MLTSTILPAAYAQLSDSTNQKPGVTTPVQVTFDTQDELIGVGHSGGDITILRDGVYFILAAGQIGETSNFRVNCDLWIRKNSTDVPNSGVRNSIATTDATNVLVTQAVLPLAAGDVIKVYQSVDNATKGAGLAVFNPAGEPRVPSIILTIYLIGS